MTAIPMAVTPPRDWSHLPARERRVIEMVLEGKTGKQISEALGIGKSNGSRLQRQAKQRLGLIKERTDVLSPCQRRAWDMLQSGASMDDIAAAMSTIRHAVHNYVSQARLKLARGEGVPTLSHERLRRLDAELAATPRCDKCLLPHQPGPCESPLRVNPWRCNQSVFER